LNDILHVGPVVQGDSFNILICFRFHKIAICSDAEKMYRQILITPEDRLLQRIVWFNSNAEISDYELNTVTYGEAPASFLVTRTVQELAHGESDKFPAASKIALREIYIDDLILEADTPNAAMTAMQELNDLMRSGGFHMRKWSSNCPKILESLNSTQHSVAADHP